MSFFIVLVSLIFNFLGNRCALYNLGYLDNRYSFELLNIINDVEIDDEIEIFIKNEGILIDVYGEECIYEKVVDNNRDFNIKNALINNKLSLREIIISLINLLMRRYNGEI